jgi:hypothetical protein
MNKTILALLALLGATSACGLNSPPRTLPVDRLSKIPADIVKGTPGNDLFPPVASPGWSQPVPLEGSVTTAGSEDSPFIPADGGALYFFFTPDARIPVQDQ